MSETTKEPREKPLTREERLEKTIEALIKERVRLQKKIKEYEEQEAANLRYQNAEKMRLMIYGDR